MASTGGYVYLNQTASTAASTSANSTCTGTITFGLAAVCNWTASFAVSINYSGSWSASYFAYYTNVKNVSGSYVGTGYNASTININAYGLAEPTLCVTATKQDSSNQKLGAFSRGGHE